MLVAVAALPGRRKPSFRVDFQALRPPFKIDVFTWYNYSLNPASHYSTGSLAVTSPEWAITRSISTKVQVAMVQQISNERPENAMYRAGLISLIIPVELSKKSKPL